MGDLLTRLGEAVAGDEPSPGRFCPRCRHEAPTPGPLCPMCGETMAAKGYCPVCEDRWALPAGADCPKHEIPLEAGPARPGGLVDPEATGELTTVGRFAEAGAAEAARIRLEAEGIPTFLQGQRMGSMSMYQVATGGIALQVPRALAADARILLAQTWAPPAVADDLDDAWDELAPEPGARRRAVMKAIILVLVFGPLVVSLVAIALRR